MCVWKIEADIIDFSGSEPNLLYRNSTVDLFMNASDSMAVSAVKGMGKTFLLKAKRYFTAQKSGITILPSNNLILDVPSNIYIKKQHVSIFSDYYQWINIWLCSISIYILSQDKYRYIVNQNMESISLQKSTKELLQQDNTGVWSVISKFTKLNTKAELHDVLTDTDTLFNMLMNIQDSIYYFIDKVDEPFDNMLDDDTFISKSTRGPVIYNIWQYAQLALVEASYKIYTGRHHIKIFSSIRQEALNGMNRISRQSDKLRSRIVQLTYSKLDLYRMFSHYVECEQPENLLYPNMATQNPVKAFVGIDKISHYSGGMENVWDYIYRHTLSRPRDIMIVCMDLFINIVGDSKYNGEIASNLIAGRIRHIVNKRSNDMSTNHISSVESFWIDKENESVGALIYAVSRKLDTNVFDIKSMKKYCCAVNHLESGDCGECKEIHVFSALYNIGMLGVIDTNNDGKGYRARINNGTNVYYSRRQELPTGRLYFAHASYSNLIRHEREAMLQPYDTVKSIIADEGAIIGEEAMRRIEDLIISHDGDKNRETVFVSSTKRDIKDLRDVVKNKLIGQGYKVLAYDDESFPPSPVESKNTHDHCIDVMLNCGKVVCIFSGRFGGEYNGDKYRSYIEECKELFSGKTPSVTFMEFFVAQKLGKDVRVYIDESIEIARGEFIANGSPLNYKSKIVENVRVFEMVGWINKMRDGVWKYSYNNVQTLEKLIAWHFQCVK